MLNKKEFLKYASRLAFPIMIQNLFGTLVNMADTVMLGYVSQTAMSASSLANQFTFILFCLYYGMAAGISVFCAQYWGKGDKKTVEKILGLAERISLIVSAVFFAVSFAMPTTIMKIFTNSPETIASGGEYLRVISFSFVFMGFSQVFMSALRSIGKIMLPSVTYVVSLCVNVICNRENYCVYYKGVVEILDRFHINSYKKTFKYILKSKKWFICGNYDDIIKAHR